MKNLTLATIMPCVCFSGAIFLSSFLQAGCEKAAPPPEQSRVEAESGISRAHVKELRWTAADGVSVYHVQAWSGDRLIFEEDSAVPQLSLSRSMRRALGGFQNVEYRVLISDAEGQRTRSEIVVETVLGAPEESAPLQ